MKSKKLKEVYVCRDCSASFPQWFGKCPDCESWNSVHLQTAKSEPGALSSGSALKLTDLKSDVKLSRESLGIDFLDRVLGGGLPRSAVVLVAGEPGIGKSTLLFQLAASLQNRSCLYVSAEESLNQLGARFQRIGESNKEKIYVMSENRLPVILEEIKKTKPDHVIIDSIQMMFGESAERVKGGQAAIREISEELVAYAKAYQFTLWIVGHVTKEGEIAGPRSLEHLVDSVLFFSSANEPDLRILQIGKHRFGQSGELALLEMTEAGLSEREGADDYWMQERQKKVSGCALASVMMGSRCYCVEVQALCVPTYFPSPRRSTSGFDYNRLLMILAVLERRLKLPFSQDDVYLNVVGGLRLQDPGADLAVAAALVSAKTEKALSLSDVFCAELGLTGELRPVANLRDRVKSAHQVKKTRFVTAPYSKLPKEQNGMDVATCVDLDEALESLFDS